MEDVVSKAVALLVAPRQLELTSEMPNVKNPVRKLDAFTKVRPRLSNAFSYAVNELNKSERSEQSIDRLSASACVIRQAHEICGIIGRSIQGAG